MARAQRGKPATQRKPGGRLAEVAEIGRTPSVVLSRVQKHLLDKSTEPTDRRQDIIHPSEMAKSDWCPRQTYYRLKGEHPDERNARKFSFQLESIFEEGHTIHGKWQAWLRDMGVLWGTWKCWCGHRWSATSPGACPKCNSYHGVSYAEVPLSAEFSHLIAGHADGAVVDSECLIEIKSIGIGTLRWEQPSLLSKYQVETVDGKKVYDLDSLWKSIKRPLNSHIKQGQIYLFLCQEMGLPYDKMVYLYEFKATQAFKEFTVKFDPAVVEPLLDQALDIKWALENDRVVARPSHVDGPETKVCKECPFRAICWGEELSDEETVPSDTDEGSGSANGAEGTRGEEEARPSEYRHARTTRVRRTRPARRLDGAERPGPDRTVPPADGVAELHGDAGSSGRGRRTLRRRSRG